jgi:anti-sigma factor RsiW
MHAKGRLTCAEAFQRLDDYVDRSLSDVEMRSVQAHLQECIACAREFRFEATLIAGIRDRLQRIAPPPALLENVRRALQAESSGC